MGLGTLMWERERGRRIESNKQSAVGHCNVQFVEWEMDTNIS
jgi:hypothetical protein